MLNSRPTFMPYKNIDLRARSVQIRILKKRPLYKSVVSPTRDLWFEGFLAKASWDAVSPCCSSQEGGRPKIFCSQWEMLPKYYIERFANNFEQFWMTMRDAPPTRGENSLICWKNKALAGCFWTLMESRWAGTNSQKITTTNIKRSQQQIHKRSQQQIHKRSQQQTHKDLDKKYN